ncbi:hypothetical protein HKD37_19G052673 [Glycine soja]|nr:hypothetical protein GmHk_19G053884 [Glycine max]
MKEQVEAWVTINYTSCLYMYVSMNMLSQSLWMQKFTSHTPAHINLGTHLDHVQVEQTKTNSTKIENKQTLNKT